jgi:serine/threonine protein kinase
MPFISISSRKKRGRSSWIFLPSQKIRILDRGNFDGTASPQEGVKARFRRRGSRVMSRLGISKEDPEDDNTHSQSNANHLCSEKEETSSIIIRSRSRHSRRNSSSVPGLSHRLSHTISSTFGHPTIVHRPSLRSRPSVRSMREGRDPIHLDDAIAPQDVSAVSTYKSGSGSSPVQVSTNPTSDGFSGSPIRSPPRHLPFTDNSRLLTFNRDCAASVLTPIMETPNIVVPSIVTVEATATAKMFFETHFRHVLSGHRPRSQRRKDLETALETCNWSHAKRDKARAAFIRQENEFLRQDRVLKSKTNATKKDKGVSIAGYEVVKVLGKGSFGVVRLVKEKVPHGPKTPSVTDLEPMKKSSMTDLSSLKSTARDTFPLFSSRRKDLTRVKKEVYAMKVIRKSTMLRNSQEGHLRAERDFLVASEHSRWIVPLIAAFQDNKNLYLVMDYCVGGDFLGLLIRKNTLSEDVTRWYIAEMILCVEEAHSLRWIHRDVKPDNFLIGANGHLKISDFGLAFDGHWSHDQAFFHNHRHLLVEKLGVEVHGDEQDRAEAEAVRASQNVGRIMAGQCQPPGKEKKAKAIEQPVEDEPIVDWRDKNQQRKLARSVVGTSQYMAPEVIRGEPYDGRCDWWSIAIILYECLFGFTPFACENRQETKLQILKHRSTLCFPDDQYGFPSLSSEVLDLMRLLLREKEERLSSPKYYLNDYTYSQVQDTNTYHIHGRADKSNKNYQGKHVYSDDADDIKAHPWFKNTDWAQIHKKKPPFVPKVKGWEDTKYFDDDESVSDMESSSSEEDDAEATPVPNKENMLGAGKVKQDPQAFEESIVAAANMDHRISGHQQEAQHIIPSTTSKINNAIHEQNQKMLDTIVNGASPDVSMVNTLGKQNSAVLSPQPQVDGGVGIDEPLLPIDVSKKSKKSKEKKRPRDKILRDHKMAKIAVDMRRRGAFLGYAYRRPKGVQSVLERVENEAKSEAEAERKGMSSIIDFIGGDSGVVGDARRDSAIAGMEMPNQIGFGAGRAGEKGKVTEFELPIRRRDTPSPRCITPVENGMGMGTGTGRTDVPRFGMI